MLLNWFMSLHPETKEFLLETYVITTLILMSLSAGVGYLVGKIGITGIKNDIHNLRNDLESFKLNAKVIPVSTTFIPGIQTPTPINVPVS